MSTVTPATTTVSPDSLPAVDLRHLSQSDLHSLSECSNSSFGCHDVVIPKIDRSVFNESAGSRKQTYSRLRLAPADSSTIHRRTPRRRTLASDVVDDPEQAENSQISSLLSELFQSNVDHLAPIEAENGVVANELSNPNLPEPVNPNLTELVNTEAPAALVNPNTPELVNPKSPELLNTEALDAGAPELLNAEVTETLDAGAPELLKTETKRKRGRPRKNESAVNVRPPVAKRMRNSTVKKVVEYDDNVDREIVNCRGVEVDLTSLGRLEDPYGPEIRSRTEGLSTADELLGFLRGLNGQWGTTRKKRRVVDASQFGDFLPKGWRLSLCIKKKEGRVWLFCRRYISPSGRQFASCKDISTYLLSIFGEENLDTPNQTHNSLDASAFKGSSENQDANLYAQEDLERNITIHNPSTPPISLPNDCEKHITYGIVGPIGLHVDDVYKCLKCFLIFEGKTELSDHQSVSHKAEKSQFGSSLPDWSIVIGGIYNCNICHKKFHEINQYNEHIGTHVTNEDKTAEKTVEPVTVSAETDHNMSFITESKNIDEVVHDLDMNEDVLVEESGDGIGNKCVNDNNVPEADKASDVSVFIPECDLDQDIFGSSNGQDSGSETRVQSSSICEEKGFQANINDARVCNSFGKLTTEKAKDVYDESPSGVFHGISNDHDTVSETRVHASSICEEKGFREDINDMHMSNSFGEFTSEKEKVVNNESSSGVFHGISDGQDAVSEDRVPALNICGDKAFQENINDAHIFGQFRELTSEKGKVVSKDSPSEVFNNRLAETKKLSESESLSLFPNRFKIEVDNSNLISSKKQDSFQKLGFAPFSQITHGFDESRFSYNVSNSKLGEQYEVRNSEFDRYSEKEHVNKEYFQIENVDKSDEFQAFRNNESVNTEAVSLGCSSQNGLNANVMDFNAGKNIEFSSLVPPGNNQAYGFQDGLKLDDIFGDKFDENIHGLSLAFGNPNSLYGDTANANEQKKDRLICSSVVSSKINDSLDVQTDLRMVNNSMVQDLKRGNESRGFQNNDNSVYSGRTWGADEGRQFMMGSVNNQMWKTPQGNQMQGGLVHPHAPIQSPNFHSFDIMSQKAQDGLFRPNERYIPSRSEPVEFRFLTDRTEHNPHALQPGSRVFPYNYNPGIEQGFDSNMMPNMSGRNVITSICAWCRNVFHLPAMGAHQQMQAGVGSLCPNCSAGISGQVNM
ncbi:uncharacterized protein LOC143533909 [Bidens hawaiensis]|uniref:uncharacterized protein LOC143533909 n=1 Tax=Bidens hawaiensis TaxID=980011 RepID=UPI00404A8098